MLQIVLNDPIGGFRICAHFLLIITLEPLLGLHITVWIKRKCQNSFITVIFHQFYFNIAVIIMNQVAFIITYHFAFL